MSQIRNICYVTTTETGENPFMDSSSRYRCFHPASALAGMGLTSRVMSADLFLRYPVDWYDAYVFHHPVDSERLASFVGQMKNEAKPVVADYGALPVQNSQGDDPVPSALQLFDRFSVADSSIREHILAMRSDARVTVVPDLLTPVQTELARMFPRRRKSDQSFQVTYIAQGKGWGADFELLGKALLEILREFPHARYLHVGADMPLGSLADHPRARAELEFDPRRSALTMSRSDVVLLPQAAVPIERFNQSAGFLEAACMDVPVIATPAPGLNNHSGRYFVAENQEEWICALRDVIMNPPAEGELVAYAQAQGTTEGSTPLYFSIFS